MIEMLTKLVVDGSYPRQERERAAEILSFVAERLKFPVEHHNPEATQADIESAVHVQKMLLEASELSILWYHPEDVLFRPVTQDGGKYRVVLSKKYHCPQAHDEPAPLL